MERVFLPKRAYMDRALELAREAFREGEVPVGAVVVLDGKIIGEGRNRREAGKSALAHAELEAIQQACRAVGGWRLDRCQLYVTLEPCPMCTGAVINAHMEAVVYGAEDDRAGCCGTAADLFGLPYSHRPQVYRGLLEEECRGLLKEFFQRMRGIEKEN